MCYWDIPQQNDPVIQFPDLRWQQIMHMLWQVCCQLRQKKSSNSTPQGQVAHKNTFLSSYISVLIFKSPTANSRSLTWKSIQVSEWVTAYFKHCIHAFNKEVT